MFPKLFIFLYSLCLVYAQYEVPDALFEPLSPRGFRVSIPDEDGIKLFAFHGKLNEELNGREGGTYSRDIIKSIDGRWTFVDKSTRLKAGDVINYWTYVDYFDGERKLGYVKDDQTFTVTDLIQDPSGSTTSTTSTTTARTTATTARNKPNKNNNCPQSLTRSSKKVQCSGKILLQENFGNNFMNKRWETEVKFAGEPDYEFVMYSDSSENIFTHKNILNIRPTLTDDRYGDGFVDSSEGLDLGLNCTGIPGTLECAQKPIAYFILPPVISARINTKSFFSFVYGIIEVRAKLPKGEWVYPEIFLNPTHSEYGAGYESGQIRIAFSPGNYNLNKKLYGGCILGPSTAARSFAMKSKESESSWGDSFHVYTVKWEPESITLLVDDDIYGYVYPTAGGFATQATELGLTAASRWRSGSVLAPFDKEMYVTIGVGVGGHSFKDEPSKPWVNNDPKSQKVFYRAKDKWHATWGQESTLQVDYIKVTAL